MRHLFAEKPAIIKSSRKNRLSPAKMGQTVEEAQMVSWPDEGGDCMKIRLNEDQEIVNTIREGLKRTGGYCPCRLERTPENKCMCQEFRDQVADENFEGFCHCMLYYKEK
jgi:ferredoxin-thioredoxin reductase catalytic subunit